ncbi:MAG: nucleoside recognition domain-containing protein [Verrucomicrobiota bacterium]|nr:spore maturation protein [Verrucomicrobiota bacterium]MCC6821139.1 spore maturation protein [Limisphaerales bacterium]
MLNYIWLGLVVAAVGIGGWHNLTGAPTGTLKEVTEKGFEMTRVAVMDIALPLVGIMALWLGIMRLAEKAGLVQLLARAFRPVMKWLFPDVPANHPAMGSMLMNMAANFLGLANAATPLGLRAMKDLETLNPRPGTATNAMCTFLAINTSSIQLLPVTAVAVLVVAGSLQPYAIIGTAILATTFSSIAGITAVKLLEKLPGYRLPPLSDTERSATEKGSPSADRAATLSPSDRERNGVGGNESTPLNGFGIGALILFFLFFVVLFVAISFPETLNHPVAAELQKQHPAVRSLNTISLLAVPFMLAFFPLYAALRRVKVYEQFVEGAKEGFQVAVTVIPFLVAILVAVGMFRGAGGIDLITQALRPVLDRIHFPTELLPMCLMRPLSGSGTLGMFTELVKEFGPDSLIARTAGTIFGSTETTFYVIAVYFGAVNVRRTRHAVPAGLIADAVGIIASVIICWMMFG